MYNLTFLLSLVSWRLIKAGKSIICQPQTPSSGIIDHPFAANGWSMTVNLYQERIRSNRCKRSSCKWKSFCGGSQCWSPLGRMANCTYERSLWHGNQNWAFIYINLAARSCHVYLAPWHRAPTGSTNNLRVPLFPTICANAFSSSADRRLRPLISLHEAERSLLIDDADRAHAVTMLHTVQTIGHLDKLRPECREDELRRVCGSLVLNHPCRFRHTNSNTASLLASLFFPGNLHAMHVSKYNTFRIADSCYHVQ